MASVSTRSSSASKTCWSEYTAGGGQCSCTRSRVSTPRFRRDRSTQARRFSGVYCPASNGSARRPALVATNGRSERATSARRMRSSERPSPYTSAVSSRVTPASSAVSRTSAALSSSTSPQSPPSCQVPRPTTLTSAPVRPSGRCSMLIVRLRPRSAPRSLSPASGRCPQHAAMLARASFSRWGSLPHARTHPLEQLAHGDGVLLAGAHVLELTDALGQVALADDDDVRGARPVGGLHRALEPAPAVDGVRGDAGLAQLPDQAHRQPLGLLAQRDDERLHAGRRPDVEALGLDRQQGAVDADGVPDARDVRAAERGRQAV